MEVYLDPDSRNGDRPISILAITKEYLPDWPYFEDLYKYLHQNPELSKQEEETSKIVATHLLAGGYEVKTNLGGYGVAGYLRNGDGPTVMLCAEFDALPMQEETGLPYSSKKRAIGEDGQEYPVMHACGHDMNTTVLLAASTFFIQAKEYWKGTVICLFLPSDEARGGALAMANDWLYSKVPVPDVILGQHVVCTKAGSIGLEPCSIIAGAKDYKLCMRSKEGPGAKPHLSVNPILVGSRIITRVTGLVKTKIPPGEFGRIDVTFIQAGETENVVPNHLDMELTISYTKPQLCKTMEDGLCNVIETEAKAAKLPQCPRLTVISGSAPTIDPDSNIAKLRAIFHERFADDVYNTPQGGGQKGLSQLARPHKIPCLCWAFGSTSPEILEDADKTGIEKEKVYKLLPKNQTARFAPVIQPTLRTGTEACALAGLCFLEVRVPTFVYRKE